MLLPLSEVGERLLLLSLFAGHSRNMVGHTALRVQQSHLIPPASLHGREGSCFPGSNPPDDTVDFKFVVGIKLAILMWWSGYHVDEFTHTWLTEHFIVQSHLCWFHRKCAHIKTHFPPEAGCEDYSF